MTPDITLVVPCYNEAERLAVDAFVAALDTYPRLRLRMVDDGSTDATADVLAHLVAQGRGRIDAFRMTTNRGKAEAVRAGLLSILTEPTLVPSAPTYAPQAGRYVGFWDADLATPLDEAIPMAEALDRRPDLEAALGVRLPLLGRQVRRRPVRAILGRTFATAVSFGLGVSLQDTQCGAKLFRAGPGLIDVLAEPFHSRWIFDVEILARMANQTTATTGPLHDRLYESPLTRWDEIPGSKLRPKDFVRAAAEWATIWSVYCAPWRSRQQLDRTVVSEISTSSDALGRCFRAIPRLRDAVSQLQPIGSVADVRPIAGTIGPPALCPAA